MRYCLLCIICCYSVLVEGQQTPRFAVRQIPVRMQARCYPMDDVAMAGVAYDLLNHNTGISIYYPHLRLADLYLLSTVHFDWRIGTDNRRYFNIEGDRKVSEVNWNTNLKISAGYKSILNGDQTINQVYLGPSLDIGTFTISGGWAYQKAKIDEREISKSGLGIHAEREFWSQCVIELSPVFWFDRWQFSAKVRENILFGGFFVGVSWQKLETWEAFDVSLLYEIN